MQILFDFQNDFLKMIKLGVSSPQKALEQINDLALKLDAIRYGCILLDIADGKKMDFDELILEKRGTTIWVHFAVKPKGNRRHVQF